MIKTHEGLRLSPVELHVTERALRNTYDTDTLQSPLLRIIAAERGKRLRNIAAMYPDTPEGMTQAQLYESKLPFILNVDQLERGCLESWRTALNLFSELTEEDIREIEASSSAEQVDVDSKFRRLDGAVAGMLLLQLNTQHPYMRPSDNDSAA